MIQAKNLVKTFRDRKRGEVHAVNGVSFEAKPGKIFGLLGANGAGKTTTLRILATLLEPTTGEAYVAGHDVRLEPEKVREKIGFLSTSTALYGRLTAREMVEYFGRLYGMPEPLLQQRLKEVFSVLEMNEFANGRCDKLSTGQKQRVSIARSIIHEPPVMIFDEPTTGLDVMTSRTIMRFIERCREQSKTVIFSTHIMSEVERLCDEVAIIHDGRIVAQGTVEELRERTGLVPLESVFLKLVGASDHD
ncbi:MAG TPA: ATP-binding cassette domain-containing protein [Acidobacteriota bacterium]|nr:ATP-binding cassette domain-containing protein [Acidobacteriota bacterium]HMZ81123.1 ATP-binding cassette domain-containing protein [Acidobacteriota bacterium]HNB69626.1 ATP-binding cassette domain-containing protein [Acidobacteriota bacterium]HND19527.1 ATP-binding cassette domain-containing protein [Acidobacteriota bacterium]HNG93864.1 ATP-binding cassette domain-containing protein [Acidobacteriota bacterium]